MKMQLNRSYNQLTKVQSEDLTSIVAETLAGGFNSSKTNLFTAADLWNIQRQGKNRTQRRAIA